MTDKQFTPGYYDDGSGTQRYWDGRAWTQHTRSAPPAEASPPPIVPPVDVDAPAPQAPTTLPIDSSFPPVQHAPVGEPATGRRRAFVEFVGRLRPRTRNTLIAGAIGIAFVVGVGAGAAGRSSDEAEAAAAAASSAAATSDPATPAATPVAAATTEPSATMPTRDVVADETSTEPEATTHGVTETDAMLACAHYGDDEFPYGFKDHAILGNIAQYIEKNHWFIKHEVTITNAFNAKVDTVFECTVGGTHTSPKITEFYVYN